MEKATSSQRLIEQGTNLYRQKRYSAALSVCAQIPDGDPLYVTSLHLQALVKRESGMLIDAVGLLERALSRAPQLLQLWLDLGNLHLTLSRYSDAVGCFNEVLKSDQSNPDILRLLGYAFHGLGRDAEAIHCYERAIQSAPQRVDLYKYASVSLVALGRYREALECIDRAVQGGMREASIFNNRSAIYLVLEEYENARIAANEALGVDIKFSQAWLSLGKALHRLGNPAQARRALLAALDLKLEGKDVYFEQGLIEAELKNYEAALGCFEKALAIDKSDLNAMCNRAACLQKMEKYDLAAEAFKEICRVNPEHAIAVNNLGVIYLYKKELELARSQFERAVSLDENYMDALLNNAVVLDQLKDIAGAKVIFERLCARWPDCPEALGWLMRTKLNLVEWSDWDALVSTLEEKLLSGYRVSTPLAGLALLSNAMSQKICSQLNAQRFDPEAYSFDCANRDVRKIRVGYFSADYYTHSVAQLMVEIFEKHDREKFEIIGFAYDHPVKDEMHWRIMAALDKVYDLDELSNAEAVKLCRDLELDVAVDLTGFTSGSREEMFVKRVAPVQVNYIGFPGSMGSNCWDYILADEVVAPPTHVEFYAEKVVWLPGSFQPNRAQMEVSDHRYTREELGLPEVGFVFCCFNGVHKLLPSVFELWMEILHRVPGSVLWMTCEKETAQQNLRALAEQRGVRGERLIFAERVALAVHLARISVADLFLDTMPFNAGANASELCVRDYLFLAVLESPSPGAWGPAS